MIKKISLLVIAISLVACNTTEDKKKETPKTVEIEKNKESIPTLTYTKEYNNLIKDTIDGGLMLIGKINKNGLNEKVFKDWYKENHYAHKLDTLTIEKIKPLLNGVQLTVFMGTWCTDSQREIPALYRILSNASFDLNNIEIYAVDHNKETPTKIEQVYKIEYVPTIIVTKNGNELGRIVEYTQESLEKDLLAILNGSGYKHAYQE